MWFFLPRGESWFRVLISAKWKTGPIPVVIDPILKLMFGCFHVTSVVQASHKREVVRIPYVVNSVLSRT